MKICFISLSYPRSSDDYILPSLHVEGKILAEDHTVDVVASSDTSGATFQILDKVRVHRFNYFFKSMQALTYTGGIISQLQKRWYQVFLVPFFAIAFTIKIFRVAKSADVIHAHWTPSAFFAIPVKYLFKKPVVVSLLGGDVRQLPRIFNKIVFRHVDAVIASTATLRQYAEHCGYAGDILDIKHCYEYDRFKDRSETAGFLKEWNIKPGNKVVTFLGRMDPFKDPITFVKSLPHVLKEVSDVTFLFVGFGILYDRVVALVNEMRLNEHVRITGARRDVPTILSASDVFVNLSPEENFLSVAIQEAMALKVACLLTDSGRTSELFTHKEYAYLVPPEDPQAAAQGLIELLTNTALREKLQNNGPLFLERNRCTKKAIKSDLTGLFQRLLDRQSAAARQ